jgi:hypothetical protein
MRELAPARLNGNIGDFETEQHDNRPIEKLDIEIGQVIAIPTHCPSKSQGRKSEFERLVPGTYAVNLCGGGSGKNQEKYGKYEAYQAEIKHGFIAVFELLKEVDHLKYLLFNS